MLVLALLTTLAAAQATSTAPSVLLQESAPPIQQTTTGSDTTQKFWPPLGVYREKDAGVTAPRVVTRPSPAQMATREFFEANRAAPKDIRREMVLEVVVLPDGTAGEIRITRSFDLGFGLDEQAVKNVKKWQFIAGTKDGLSVPVLLEITLTWCSGPTAGPVTCSQPAKCEGDAAAGVGR